MNLRHNKSITLLELVISISILGLLALAFSNLDTFTRYHVMTSDRRARLQHEASYVLEHMAKEITKAIGDFSQVPVEGTATARIEGDPAIKIWIDYNGSKGLRDTSDRQIAYRFTSTTSNPNDKYQIWYYSNCVGSDCGSQPEVLARQITGFSATYDSANSYVDVQITACWDPDGSPLACGTPDNPSINLHNSIDLPSVSHH
jgi:type II secretory pathway pseudopilin PulG